MQFTVKLGEVLLDVLDVYPMVQCGGWSSGGGYRCKSSHKGRLEENTMGWKMSALPGWNTGAMSGWGIMKGIPGHILPHPCEGPEVYV